MNNTIEMQEHRASAQVRERLTAMLEELQTNQALLHQLNLGYRMFRFTGGDVPRQPWRLVAITSYVEHPFAADRVCTSEAVRYCYLAETIMALGQTVATGRPRTLRQRWDLAKTFAEAELEIDTIRGELATAFTGVFDELAASPSFAERMHAFGSGEQDLSPSEAVEERPRRSS